MTMQPSRVSGSDTLAEVLREQPPVPDDLARARMEKRLVLAAHAPRAPGRSRPRAALVIAGGAVALAAAIVLAVVATDEPDAPIARFERREATASVERGTLEEGSSLRTAEDEVAEIQVADSRVRIGGASRVRIAGLARDRVALELDEGTVEVAFHPRERGSERMTVETPDARVEVVGTVFRVTATGGATEVSVSEGTVRVVPLGGGEPRLVHAGDSTRVTRSLALAEPSPSEVEVEAEIVEGVEIVEGEIVEGEIVEGEIVEGEAVEAEIATVERAEPAAVPAAALTPAEQLAEARRLIHARRAPAALRVLRELARSPVPVDVRVEAWLLMADVHLADRSLGDRRYDEAARAYESAAREGRGRTGGHNAIFSLAQLQHRRLADHDAARASYQRYLEEAPTGALASQARRALCALGEPDHCEPRP